MDILHLPSYLERAQRVLVSDAGGGFDVHTGLPIYAHLKALGKQVFLGNLSFTQLADSNAKRLTPALYCVDATTTGQELYFPERALAAFLASAVKTLRSTPPKSSGLRQFEKAINIWFDRCISTPLFWSTEVRTSFSAAMKQVWARPLKT